MNYIINITHLIFIIITLFFNLDFIAKMHYHSQPFFCSWTLRLALEYFELGPAVSKCPGNFYENKGSKSGSYLLQEKAKGTVTEFSFLQLCFFSVARWLQAKPHRRGGGSWRASHPGVPAAPGTPRTHHLLEKRQSSNRWQGRKNQCELNKNECLERLNSKS